MVIDTSLFEEFPYIGTFYEKRIDDSLPLDEQEEKKFVVSKVRCDIQESDRTFSSGKITASYSIYFPFNKDEGLRIKKGMSFEGDVYGLKISGEVIGIAPSQLCKCVAYIKDFDV